MLFISSDGYFRVIGRYNSPWVLFPSKSGLKIVKPPKQLAYLVILNGLACWLTSAPGPSSGHSVRNYFSRVNFRATDLALSLLLININLGSGITQIVSGMSLPLILIMHNNIAVLWARKRGHIFECGSIIPCILWYSLCYQNVSASAEPTHLETWLDQLKSIMQLLFPFDPFYLLKLPAFFFFFFGR